MSVKQINPNAEVMRRPQALAVNVAAGKGLQDLLKTNLGPRGTLKMLVGGAGQIKLSKDGGVILHEMQIAHPTAIMIARSATAQDDNVGDGTTSCVVLIGELLKQAERFLLEGVHPRTLADGMVLAKDRCLQLLKEFSVPLEDATDREMLISVARTALRAKLKTELADHLAEVCTDAVLTIKQGDAPVDLHMVERMHMIHKNDMDTRLVRGLVLDHGARHVDMPKFVSGNVKVLAINVSMEYEKTEVNSSFQFTTAAERDRLIESERKVTDDKVRQVIELKRRVCTDENTHFVVVNLKGIDPLSLDMLAKEGIIGIRRAKRRNMERMALSLGCTPINDVSELSPEILGSASKVYEQVLGDNKYTFIHADPAKPCQSCTVLVCGNAPHIIAQIKDAVRDGLRVVRNAIEDARVTPGGGAFEIAAHADLMSSFIKTVKGKAKRGVETFAKALLCIPKTLAENSGLDVSDTIIKVEEEYEESGMACGIDLDSGEPMSPVDEGVFDGYRVKRQMLQLSTMLTSQLLLVDEVMRAGRGSRGGK